MGKKYGEKINPKANRKFNGKIYACHGTYGKKTDAKKYAKVGKEQGKKVRIVPFQDRWAVYVR